MTDVIFLALGALVVAACLQVSAAWGLPWVLLAAAGVVAVALAAVRYRAQRREPPAGRTAEPGRTVALGILVAVVLAALAIRLYTLMDRPAWDDEMWTLRNMYTSDWGELFRVAFDDYWPPLHYILLNTIARIADTGIFWLRIPSVVFGVATVAAMYPLGMLLFRSRVAGLASAALLAGMTSHVVYSQEARVYAMQLFLVVLSAYFFYRSYWQRRISPAFLLTTTLLTYSHSFASWYYLAGQCVYVVVAAWIWRDRKAFVKGFLSETLVLLLWLPLVGFFLYARLSRDIVIPTYWATGEGVDKGLLAILELYQGLGVRSYAGAAFLALLFGLVAWLAWRDLRPRPAEPVEQPGTAQAVVFLLCWIITPVLFSLTISTFTSMATFPEIRYHMAVVPGLCALAGGGFLALRTRPQLALGALLLVLLPAGELQRYWYGFQRDAQDEAAAIVRENGTPDETIYVGNGYRVFGYYFRGFFPRIGSAQWDSLAASVADLDDVHTLYSPKWGDTYAYEKLSPRVKYYGYYVYQPNRYERFITEELAKGGFRGNYWLVLEKDARGARVLEVLAEHDATCRNESIVEVRGLEVRHCMDGTAAALPAAAPDTISRAP